jgi:hypothetical protein
VIIVTSVFSDIYHMSRWMPYTQSGFIKILSLIIPFAIHKNKYCKGENQTACNVLKMNEAKAL